MTKEKQALIESLTSKSVFLWSALDDATKEAYITKEIKQRTAAVIGAWTPDRVEELDDTFNLLNTIAQIDCGSNFIEKLTFAIKIAKLLTTSDLAKPRDSFMLFLTKLYRQSRTLTAINEEE